MEFDNILTIFSKNWVRMFTRYIIYKPNNQ